MPKLQNPQMSDADFLASVQAGINKAFRSAQRNNRSQENAGNPDYWKKQKHNMKHQVKSWDAITEYLA